MKVREAFYRCLWQFVFKMETEARRGVGYAGVPRGTSSKARPMGNEGIRLKTNCHGEV
jgi:hypothetical protein